MQIFTDIDDVKKYINVSRNLDIKILPPYEQSALNKICEFIPFLLFEEIQNDYKVIFEEIKRATANYMIAFAIPFLKIHISNTGGNNFEDSKMKTAQWWDIRDYGLSAVRIADEALSKAISLLLATDLSEQLQLGLDEDSIFKTPEEFNKIYPIGNSWDIFKKLKPQIAYVWQTFLEDRLNECSINTLMKDTKLAKLLKSIVGFYTVSEIITDPTYLFITSGIVLQWEELPWQRSKVIEPKQVEKLSEKFVEKANKLFNKLIAYLKQHSDEFPCFQTQTPVIREAIAKKSGLYL